jgi:hypothetical protein
LAAPDLLEATPGAQFPLSFGYPEKSEALSWPKRAGGRKSLADIVHEERW